MNDLKKVKVLISSLSCKLTLVLASRSTSTSTVDTHFEALQNNSIDLESSLYQAYNFH